MGRHAEERIRTFTHLSTSHIHPRLPQVWQERLRNRPIVTGGFLWPTLYNKIMPRLKPQPMHVTMMIADRRKARTKRQARFMAYNEVVRELQQEARFERMLMENGQQFSAEFARREKEWGAFLVSS